MGVYDIITKPLSPNVENQRPEKWDKNFDYTDDMADYINELAVLENSILKGFEEKLSPGRQAVIETNDDKFYEYLSLEGGSNTIGYGHKIKKGENFSKGISISEAKELLVKDTMAAYKRAYNSYKNRLYRLNFRIKY